MDLIFIGMCFRGIYGNMQLWENVITSSHYWDGIIEISPYMFSYVEREFDKDNIYEITQDKDNSVDIAYKDGSHELVKNPINIEDKLPIIADPIKKLNDNSIGIGDKLPINYLDNNADISKYTISPKYITTKKHD